MPGIQVAQSNKGKRAKKALSHIEIHPKLDGGHLVRHIYHGFGHEPTDHHFNEAGITQGGTSISSHLAQHAGIKGLESYDKHDQSETEGEIDA